MPRGRQLRSGRRGQTAQPPPAASGSVCRHPRHFCQKVGYHRRGQTAQPPPAASGSVCRHPRHFCQKECLEGFAMCSLHILEDRSAPYRPCNHVYGNGKKCGVPVSKKDSQQQCQQHRRRLLLARERAERPRQPAESVAVLAEQLQKNITAAAQTSACSAATAAGDGWESAQRALQYGSDSDSAEGEGEGDRTVENPLEPPLSSDDCLSGLSDDDEAALRHAGVYTDDEVIRLAERRLRRLHHLYLGQFDRLQHVLKTKRRAYLLEVAREKETMKSISGAPRETAAEQQAYDLLRAHSHHQKPAGKDYWFWQQRLEKRSAEAGEASRTRTVSRCAHAEGRVRCTVRTVPLSKYCLRHIVQDQHQVLFRPCGGGGSAEPCPMSVAAVQPDSRCRLHTPLPEAGPVRMPQPLPDPVEVMLGLTDGDDLLLDEAQSQLVASIANTLMASAGRLDQAVGGATEPPLGGAAVGTAAAGGGAKSDSQDESGQRSELSSEVDVTGDTRSGSPAEGTASGTRSGSPMDVNVTE